MPHLPSLPDDARLADVFTRYPETSFPLLAYHETVMRGPSPFTLAERELIAAYVSGVNGCAYCHGVHTQTAQAFGVPEGLLAAALADLDTAPVDDKLKPVLRYVRKLTLTPTQVTAEDAAEVIAGWEEKGLHDAVMVCALFNFMNRMVEGHGISADAAYYALSGKRLHDIGYDGLARKLGA
ncbi:carboxymuconolactone decarboxylase family protein [Actinokineospora sp. NPDC004072]